MNAGRAHSSALAGQPSGGAGGEPAKPTRAECLAAAAPHLAALVLTKRGQSRARAAEPPTPPAARPAA